MSSLTDQIEQVILELLDAHDGVCEIARNAFAAEMEVTPSQITYVISTRFSHRQGYLVESRRGGAGYVRIRRVPYSDEADFVMQRVRSMEDRLSQHDAHMMVDELATLDVVSDEMRRLMRAALSNHSLGALKGPIRDRTRADILRNMMTMIATLTEEDN
ncbi:MAG: CtsR family transcriptional regulator [Saccharofermentanales bacterium]|jgi:transcriptional regulator CtsR